jgi:hypothetical protein
MEFACANRNIGYDQYQRDTLYTVSKPVGFNCRRVDTPCETDCSALVRVCVNYAGIPVGNFRTPDEAAKLLKTGEFVELKGSKYTDQSAYLGRGDILVTRTQGHTVVVLSNGKKYEGCPENIPGLPTGGEAEPGSRILRHGSAGSDVKAMQEALIRLGYDLGKFGADGDFGDCTELALIVFQTAAGIDADGECGPVTFAALNKALEALEDATTVGTQTVRIGTTTASNLSNGLVASPRSGCACPRARTVTCGWTCGCVRCAPLTSLRRADASMTRSSRGWRPSAATACAASTCSSSRRSSPCPRRT